MRRHQIYLDPKAVDTLDTLSRAMGVSRSHVIRDVISRIMREYEKVISSGKKTVSLKNHPLMKMAGIAKSPTGDVASGIDEIYLQD